MEGLALTEARWRAKRRARLWPGRVVTDYLDRWVEQKPDATALVAWRTEERPDAPHLAPARAPRRGAARALADAGVRPGDVVSFQLPNWWEFVALYLATVRLGAVANPLMPIFRRREPRSCCASPNRACSSRRSASAASTTARSRGSPPSFPA